MSRDHKELQSVKDLESIKTELHSQVQKLCEYKKNFKAVHMDLGAKS